MKHGGVVCFPPFTCPRRPCPRLPPVRKCLRPPLPPPHPWPPALWRGASLQVITKHRITHNASRLAARPRAAPPQAPPASARGPVARRRWWRVMKRRRRSRQMRSAQRPIQAARAIAAHAHGATLHRVRVKHACATWGGDIGGRGRFVGKRRKRFGSRARERSSRLNPRRRRCRRNISNGATRRHSASPHLRPRTRARPPPAPAPPAPPPRDRQRTPHWAAMSNTRRRGGTAPSRGWARGATQARGERTQHAAATWRAVGRSSNGIDQTRAWCIQFIEQRPMPLRQQPSPPVAPCPAFGNPCCAPPSQACDAPGCSTTRSDSRSTA